MLLSELDFSGSPDGDRCTVPRGGGLQVDVWVGNDPDILHMYLEREGETSEKLTMNIILGRTDLCHWSIEAQAVLHFMMTATREEAEKLKESEAS